MFRALLVCLLWVGMTVRASADDELGRQRFDEGVAAAEDKRWADAVRLFEESLTHEDRPAARFNLVLASHELSRPLDVMRHGLAFLATPERDAQAEARARTRVLMDQASARLAVVTTASLPDSAALMVDGFPPLVRDGKSLYLLPGLHRFEASFENGAHESVELQLSAAQNTAWPRAQARVPLNEQSLTTLPAAPVSAEHDDSVARLRTRFAWTSGMIGASLAVAATGCYWGLTHRADEVRSTPSTADGYLTLSDDYLRLQNTVIPLALVGGAMMAGAVGIGPRTYRHDSLALRLISLVSGGALLGVGGTLMIREPEILIPGTQVTRPGVQAGSLFVSAALPLLTYAIAAHFGRHRDRARVVSSWSSFRMSW